MQTLRPMRKLGWLALVASCAPACADNGKSADAGPGAPSEVTYWQDMVPLFEQHCLQCHQEGGIGHGRLDLYAEAKEHAKDSGKPFDESKVKAGASYSIEGTGAVILAN